MESVERKSFSPKDLFMLIYNNLLEGMPCDRVNEETAASEAEFTWRTTINIHSQYWENVKGDIKNFDVLRDAWINGFLSAAGKEYSYIRTEDGYNSIRKG